LSKHQRMPGELLQAVVVMVCVCEHRVIYYKILDLALLLLIMLLALNTWKYK